MAKNINPDAPMNKQGKWAYTWHMMKVNKGCYGLLLPFMILFVIFTVVPVVMSLPMGFTNFNMIQTPKFTFKLLYAVFERRRIPDRCKKHSYICDFHRTVLIHTQLLYCLADQ